MIGMMLFGALLLLIAGRLVLLGLDHTPPNGGAAGAFVPARGEIADRNGVPLARNFTAYALAARPFDVVADKRALARRLALVVPSRTEAQILAALKHPGKFRYIARRITPRQAQAIRRIGDPGITLERERERLYPNLALASQLIGYTGIDGRGEGGIERAFDARLTDQAARAKPLVLAMDARVQQAMESELAASMVKHSATGAAGVVLDARTGEVIAMASLPTFNANQPGGLAGMPEYMNRATLAVFELGSTFKAFTIAMGLESGAISGMAQQWDAVNNIRIGRFTIKDDHPQRRMMSVPDVFVYSSNLGTARMAAAYGPLVQQNYLRKLGFMDKVSGELRERGRTLYPAPAAWGQSSVMTVGFGHGIAVTPLHLAVGYAALVNGGEYRPATFLKVDGPPPPGRRVFSRQTSDTIRGLLRVAVTDGTGGKADAPGYRIGGKTGTAEKPRPGGGYSDQNITTFAGAFPMDAPRYVVIVMLDGGQGTKDTHGFKSAGWLAAPMMKRVVERIAPVLNVAPDSNEDGQWGSELAALRQHIRPKNKK
jgi:cell division protein FtsI (penicillin-binding protein 3)